MNGEESLRLRLIIFAQKVLNRLRFFPVTLMMVLLYAARKLLQLRQGVAVVRVGEATGEARDLPRNVMLWLNQVLRNPAGQQFDVCLRLSPAAIDTNLHDVFSAVLTFPRFRSIGLYWDASSLSDDLPLWQKQNGSDAAASVRGEDLGSSSVTRLEEFFQADHGEIALPVAASRDAQTLLKRQAGSAWVACLNLPPEQSSLAGILANARPDVRFFDFSATLSKETRVSNHQSIVDHGLTLHERMAIVVAADAYIGSFDELGCAALISGRRTVMLGGGASNRHDRIGRGDGAVWFPRPLEPAALTIEVLQFLETSIPCRIANSR